ncbi:cytochrome b [Rubellimicrobium aerolatum]|uniref:Cytochrome b n=1 Tax=Rubellimicrobium aerolatum TaxID=490979 RepID=A0ABW0SDV7_9RHOB|nr:cytochrome b/b6 domain-containing protein [Rubellimicrobium aerolatum]MBP1807008.1 cytochrome b561 [Rubellimicrobium aerolatum]
MSTIEGMRPAISHRLAEARRRLAPLRHQGPEAPAHHWATKWVHWVAAALLVFAYVSNGDVTGALRDPSAMRFEVWVGIAVTVAYGALWLLVRSASKGSRLPAEAPWWERLLAGLVHKGIYLSIAAVILTGFAMAWLAPSDVTVIGPGFFGIQTTTRFALARDLHEFMAELLGWLFAAHFVGALWHRVVRHDGVLRSISVLQRVKTI